MPFLFVALRLSVAMAPDSRVDATDETPSGSLIDFAWIRRCQPSTDHWSVASSVGRARQPASTPDPRRHLVLAARRRLGSPVSASGGPTRPHLVTESPAHGSPGCCGLVTTFRRRRRQVIGTLIKGKVDGIVTPLTPLSFGSSLPQSRSSSVPRRRPRGLGRDGAVVRVGVGDSRCARGLVLRRRLEAQSP